MDTAGGRRGGELSGADVYARPHVEQAVNSGWTARELISVLRDAPGRGRRLQRAGMYVCIELIHFTATETDTL